MVIGEVTSYLHLIIKVALLQVSACVSLSLLWQGYYISTMLEGEYMMAKGIKYSSRTGGDKLSHLRCLGPATT